MQEDMNKYKNKIIQVSPVFLIVYGLVPITKTTSCVPTSSQGCLSTYSAFQDSATDIVDLPPTEPQRHSRTGWGSHGCFSARYQTGESHLSSVT